jgi:proteasome lid subunit RPN8/RPN11
MSIETAVVFGNDMEAIHWHLPAGRSASYMPDSADLWSVLMKNKEQVMGVAHSHPGYGSPAPSWTDITTFSGCELGLGKRLLWPIISRNRVSFYMFEGPHKYNYREVFVDQELFWLPKLIEFSYNI